MNTEQRKMVAKYGDMITHVLIRQLAEQETTIAQITGWLMILKLAIVICQAVPGSIPALQGQGKASRHYLCSEPRTKIRHGS